LVTIESVSRPVARPLKVVADVDVDDVPAVLAALVVPDTVDISAYLQEKTPFLLAVKTTSFIPH
jgi:hypothetical protein